MISAIVFSEIAEGTYSIASFYERRIRRIFPALFAMLLAFTVCALIYIFPFEMVRYAKSLLAAAASVSNFCTLLAAIRVFRYSNFQSIAAHLVACGRRAVLSIFPVVSLGGSAILSKAAEAFSRRAFLRFTCGQRNPRTSSSPTAAFYAPYTRAWELLLGTFLALRLFPNLPTDWLRNASPLTGIAMVGYSISTYNATMLFPGLSALLPCIGSALLIHAGETGSSAVGRVLSWRPVVLIGLISYSLYLWHWPVILLHKTGLLLGMSTMPVWLWDKPLPDTTTIASRVLLSFILAVLSLEICAGEAVPLLAACD